MAHESSRVTKSSGMLLPVSPGGWRRACLSVCLRLSLVVDVHQAYS